MKTHKPVLACLVCAVFASSQGNNSQQGSSGIFLLISNTKGSIKWLSFLVGIPFVVILC